MSASIEVLSTYVPSLVLARLMAEAPGLADRGIERSEAAILFADISGFTSLTERLAALGSKGSELLSDALNAYFERLIELIASHGGDVVKMAGDALIALWPATGGESPAGSTSRAALCGLAVQETLRDYRVAEGIRLSSKVGIGAGEVASLFVGGERERWELLLAGSPLVQMGEAEHLARAGDVVLSPEAWSLVREGCVGDPLDGGFVRLRQARAMSPRLLEPLRAGHEVALAVRSFIPGAIRARLDAGQDQWLAELRRLTVLFVNVPLMELDAPDADRRAREIVRVVQNRLYRHEGSLNKLSVDEKGTTLVAAFGLPPLAHQDDARRALRTSSEIREALRGIGVECSIGVATGRVYCGEIGNARRREYTIIGRVVNLAARLMQAAKGGPEILCDEETTRASRGCFEFEALPPRSLKNIEGLVPLFRPLREVPSCGESRTTIGRTVERSMLLARLGALREGRGAVVVIEGEPGIGKSRLVAGLVDQARSRGVATLIGGGDSIERSTPYHAWRPVFQSLLGEADPIAWLVDDPEALALAPLLNAVLPLDLPENARTAPMAGQVRLDNTNDLLLRLLRRGSASRPTLLVLDDAHWLDSASSSLALQVARGMGEALLVVASRPSDSAFTDQYQSLIQVADDILRLGNLSSEDALALARDRLGVVALPGDVEELILRRAQGNPLYCEELSYALRDAGLLRFEGGECRVAPGVDLASIGIPDSVEGIINDRVDRLSPPRQMALKVASVIGRLFSLRLLRDVYPIEPDRSGIPGHLDSLSRLELILLEEPEPDLAYIFRHVITREVVYDLLPFAQRMRLHHDVARWYEQTLGGDLSAHYPLLAHHWSLAGEEARAIDYLEKAGEHALRGGAYREAAGFLERALALQAKVAPGLEPVREARWEYMLGETHLSLGHLVQSREHVGRALALLGKPIPSLFQLPAGYVAQLALQASRRISPRMVNGRMNDDRVQGPSPSTIVHPPIDHASSNDKAARRLASSAFGLVGQLCYFDQDKAFGVYSALRSLNLAERDGPSPELARALAVMCIASGLVPAHSLAEVYRGRAFEVAGQIDDIASRAWVLQLTGMYELGVGRWERSRANLEEAVAINRGLGDWRRWEESSGELARLDFCLGRFEESIRRFLEFGDEAARRGHDQAAAWGLHGQAKSLLRLGRLDEALALLERSLAMPVEALGGGDVILRGGLLAQLHARRHDWQSARRFADETFQVIHHSPPMVSYSDEGYAGMTDAYLALWEAGQGRDSRRLAWLSIASLRRIARLYPVEMPRVWICLGKAHRLDGRARRAQAALKKAIRSAGALAIPYEQALACLEYGRALDRHDPGRPAQFEQARVILNRLMIETSVDQAREAVVP
jgi:class 3 adenylate cyclase/tetratricopeptide (TPR) repeat protein